MTAVLERLDRTHVVDHAREVLERIVPPEVEVDPKTPARMVKALTELTCGYEVDPAALLATTFPANGYDQIVCVRAIPFVSVCEHHVMPFTGTVSVAYLPGRVIVGLSKIPRVVRAVTRRLQVQERIGQDIVAAMRTLEPRGVAVLIEGRHSCMQLRGVESSGSMVTSALDGVFLEDPAARAEVMGLMR